MSRDEWLKGAKLDWVDGYESHMYFSLFRWAGMPARIYWTSLAEMVHNHSIMLGDSSKFRKRVWELLFLAERV